ncbi:MAG TPA: DUF1634 domain-containing protein [Vicinamibacterales bacterium]|nr:DUF1634 domain-containing protein [Vicinamibacterales bacterium]
MRTSEATLQHLELVLGRLLQAGVIASAACLATGLAAWMAAGPSGFANAMLTLGLMVLMATPILRVVVSLVVYVRMRDWFFVATTVMVFVLLAVTVTLALTRSGG